MIANPDRFHHGGKARGPQEQIAHAARIGPTEIMMPIERQGSWKMPTLVEITTGPIATPACIH
jgi:hypothetical protein